MRRTTALVGLLVLTACGGADQGGQSSGAPSETAMTGVGHDLFDLWGRKVPAFGVFVPNERENPRERGPDGRPLPAVYSVEGARRLADDPLLDYVFLNLEGRYDRAAVETLVEGLHSGTRDTRPALLVRIPTIEAAGEDATKARIAEALELGADGVVVPHVRSPDEARAVIGFFEAAGADVWSPQNPDGRVVAMIMLEDRAAVEAAEEVANLPGFTVLACGIGSYTADLDGDREAAEAGNLKVLQYATQTGHPDMITANSDDAAKRIADGFLALLMNGPEADDAIRIGRQAANRDGM